MNVLTRCAKLWLSTLVEILTMPCNRHCCHMWRPWKWWCNALAKCVKLIQRYPTLCAWHCDKPKHLHNVINPVTVLLDDQSRFNLICTYNKAPTQCRKQGWLKEAIDKGSFQVIQKTPSVRWNVSFLITLKLSIINQKGKIMFLNYYSLSD